MARKRAEAEGRSADDGAAVTEAALLALNGICAFLAANTALAEQCAELSATPPLVGLEPYLDAVLMDPADIDEVVAEKRADVEEERRADDGAADMKVAVAKSTEGAGASGASGESHPSHGLVKVGRFTAPQLPTCYLLF